MAKAKADLFSQLGYLEVVEGGATTLTFNGLSVFSNVLSSKGIIIHRAEYTFPAASAQIINAIGDGVVFGLAGDDGMTGIDLDDPEVYDYNFLFVPVSGTPAAAWDRIMPFVKDLSGLPSGGLLVPADRLYAYILGVSTASALTLRVRFWYTMIDLTAQEYLELAQSMRVMK